MIFLAKILRSNKAKHISILISFVLLISTVYAQTGVINNGAKMIIKSGAVIKITGTGADYTNATSGGSDGRIDLAGKIELEGDWTNNATSGKVLINVNSDGEVVFNGSALQSIDGTAASDFEKLTLDNTAGLSLSNNVRVNANVSLTNGLFTLNSSNLTLGTGGTITGTFSASKMILVNGTGTLIKLFSNIGSFTFPIGESTGTVEYSPVDFTLNSYGGAVNANVSAHVTNAKHPSNDSPSEFLNRYWTLASSGFTSPNYDVDFHYLDADINGTEANIYAAEYNGGRTVYSTVTDASNTMSIAGLSAFADYTGVDGTVPSVIITCGELDPSNADPIAFTATFSEAVSGFTFDDITIANGSTAAVSTGDNTVFTFNVVPTTDGEVTVDIGAGVCTDVAGNDNTAATQYSIIYDGTSPNVNLTTSEVSPTNASPFAVKVQFTEKVSGFDVGDISVTNGGASNLVNVEIDSVWTVDITPTGDGAVLVDIAGAAASDAAGNSNIAATQFSINYDGTDPTVLSITSTESSPTNAGTIPITVEFSEAVSGFALEDITVGNGTKGAFNTSDNITFTAEVYPTGSAVTVDIGAGVATDVAGNSNTAATQFSITYDGTEPTVAITSGETDPTNTTPFEVTITFNEVVSGFDIGDITVGNGSVGNLLNPTLNQIWTADITPTAPGLVTVDIAGAVVTDAAGNGNAAATQYNFTFDNVDPTATYTPTDEATGVSLNKNLSINFSENIVKGTGNIIITDATLASQHESIAVSSGQVTVVDSVVTINPSSDFITTNEYYVQIDASAFDDVAGNSFAGILDATTWNFTAVDANSPYITETLPLDGAVDVSVSGDIVLTFSEPVIKGTGDILIKNSDGTTHETIAVSSGSVTIVSNVVTISQSGLTGEKGYYILIPSGAFNDGTLDFAGISTSDDLNFTTEDIDAPTISSKAPADDATDVIISSDLEITFNEDVAKGTGNIIITNATLSSQQSIDVTSGQVTIVDNVVTINPSTDFNGETDYYVEFASGVFTDASSNLNVHAGITDATTWNFTTEDIANPTVVVSTAELITNNSPFVATLTFSEVVFNLTDGDISVTNGTASGLSSSDGGKTYTVDITPAGEFTVSVSVPVGVAQDAEGNGNEASNVVDVVYDITDPTVTITSAQSGTTNISPFELTITFNEDISSFTSGDITVDNGTADNVQNTTPNRVWTADITPIADGSVTIDVLVGDVTDVAGNGNIASNQLQINYDGSGPAVDVLYPLDDAANVTVSDNLQITFDEIVNLGTGNITLYKVVGDVPVENISVASVTGAGTKTITINPTADLESEVEYYVLVPSGAFTDAVGNDFAGINISTDWSFTAADISKPIVSSLSPTDGSGNVAVGSTLIITFNETVTANVGNITIMNADVDLEHEIIDVTSLQVDVSSNVVTITPSADFDGETNYYVLVGGSTFRDLSGNNFAGISSTTAWNFNTEDVNPPEYAALSPLNNAVSVAVSSNLQITFDENVVLGTGDITIMDVTNSAIFETIAIDAANVTISGNTVTIDPLVNFAGLTDYYVLIDAGVVQDAIGNAFVGISDVNEWSFKSGDVSAPTVISRSPADNSTDISISSNLVLNFNESVTANTGSITIVNSTTSATHEVIDVTSGLVSVSGSVVTINPSIDFDGESDYYAIVDNGAFQDLESNLFGGILATTDWNFTTEDITAPTASTFTPTDGATGVSIGSNLTITFSENIAKGSGNITISKVSDSSVHEVINVSSGNVIVSGSTLSIDPTLIFAGLTDYYVEIASSAIQDLAGNNYAGISGATAWNFTTADASAPVVSTFSPANNSTGVAIGTNLQITFNETVEANTGNITIMNATASSTHEIIAVNSGLVTIASNVVTINPATDFTGSNNYYILIESGAFQDVESNAYAGISLNTEWNFTTADVSAPVVNTYSPADGATDVDVTTDLVLTFDETVVKNTGNITIMNATTSATHEIIDVTSSQVSVSGNIVTISPLVSFDGMTDYYVQIENDAFRDLEANAYGGISDATTWNFKTIDNIAPSIFSRTPADNETYVSTTANLEIVFDENVFVNTGNISIVNTTTSLALETIDVTSDFVTIVTNTVTINPSSDFEESTDYHILIDNDAFRDAAGNSFSGIAGATTWNFTTADLTLPTIATVSPIDDATDVTINSDLVITFSENVIANTGLISIMDANGIHESIDVTLTTQVSIVSNIVTINPGIDFVGATDYYVLIAGDAFHDESGNSFAGISDATVWNFTSAEVSVPTVVTLSPADNSTGIALNSNLQITFSEPVVENTGFITIMNAAGAHETIDVTSAQVTLASNLVTIDPANDFTGETDYYVLIDNTAFQDVNGYGFAGITDATVWNFTTVDLTQPTVSITSTASGTVTSSFEIVVTFSEAVTGFTVDDFTLTNCTLTDFTETTPGLSWTATINPIADGTVNVEIASGLAQDAAGNLNTASNLFAVTYSGVGFEDRIPYELAIYSVGNKVILEFTNEGNYQFNEGKIEVFNLLGQKILDQKILDFVRSEATVEHVTQLYVVKVTIDGVPYTKRLYIE